MAMAASNTKKWTGKLLSNVIQKHNSEFIGKTSFRRTDVTRANFQQFLSEYTGLPYPSFTFNNSSFTSNTIANKKWQSILWKGLKVNDKVLLSNRSNWARKKKFYKPSSEGSYTKKIYKITELSIKNSSHYYLVPVVRLDAIKGYFYPSELLKVPSDIANNSDTEPGE
jgi:hypothetical protein